MELKRFNQYLQIREYHSEEGWTLPYLVFPGFEKEKGIRHLFTTREGGVSEGIYASLNFSFTRGDNPDAVRENFRRLAAVFDSEPSRIVCTDQTHTTNIRVVTEEDAGKGVTRQRDYTDTDGIITDVAGLILATFYADCVPLYFYDPKKRVIGLSHSGWRGTVNGIGAETVRKMQAVFGCNPEDIRAAIGPSICRKCYEIGEEPALVFAKNADSKTAAHFDEIFTERHRSETGETKYYMDLWAANRFVLLSAGIRPENLEVTDVCTAHNAQQLFSHRASGGKRGNLGAFLMLEG